MVTIFSAAFGAVYELFSHGVYAYGMLYAFAFPLLFGLLPAFLLARYGRHFPSPVAWQLWHFGISALTVGSLFSGALEIYGTSSQLTMFYWLSGGLCLLLSLLTMAFLPARNEERPKDKAVASSTG
ncbi:MAG: hypothetical protein IJQ45_03460 [Clostridia bacterium]|nr:hypothetical protein [Clostridia bacterium]MBR0205786.1 hypothetical protein [Clostridia bacterium]